MVSSTKKRKGRGIAERNAYRRYVDSIANSENAPWQIKRAIELYPEDGIEWRRVKRVVEFIKCLRHSLGPSAGMPFVLSPWQLWIVAELFGRVGKDGYRQYRRAFVSVPRKNGKTTFAAALALYLLIGDNEAGPEIVSVAVAKEQANRLVNEVKRMRAAWPSGRKYTKAQRNTVQCPGNNGIILAASADKDVLWGRNASAAFVDELHAHKTRDLWDATITATASRRQPLVFCTSTVGADKTTLYTELRNYSEQLLTGELSDPSWFSFIAGADEGDDPSSPETWAKANPNLGVSVFEADLDASWRAARTPASVAAFRMYHLNDTLAQTGDWVSFELWKQGYVVEIPDMTNRDCYIGLDLSSTTDLTAAVLAFPDADGAVWIIPQAWCTRDAMLRGKQSRLYRQWHNEHAITVCPGHVIDYFAVREFLKEARKKYRVQKLYCDPFNARHLLSELVQDGFREDTIIEHPQFASHMDGPIRETERLILSGKLYHKPNSALDACIRNVKVKVDSTSRLRFDKKTATGPIDIAVALVMAAGHCKQTATPQQPFFFQVIQ